MLDKFIAFNGEFEGKRFPDVFQFAADSQENENLERLLEKYLEHLPNSLDLDNNPDVESKLAKKIARSIISHTDSGGQFHEDIALQNFINLDLSTFIDRNHKVEDLLYGKWSGMERLNVQTCLSTFNFDRYIGEGEKGKERYKAAFNTLLSCLEGVIFKQTTPNKNLLFACAMYAADIANNSDLESLEDIRNFTIKSGSNKKLKKVNQYNDSEFIENYNEINRAIRELGKYQNKAKKEESKIPHTLSWNRAASPIVNTLSQEGAVKGTLAGAAIAAVGVAVLIGAALLLSHWLLIAGVVVGSLMIAGGVATSGGAIARSAYKEHSKRSENSNKSQDPDISEKESLIPGKSGNHWQQKSHRGRDTSTILNK